MADLFCPEEVTAEVEERIAALVKKAPTEDWPCRKNGLGHSRRHRRTGRLLDKVRNRGSTGALDGRPETVSVGSCTRAYDAEGLHDG